jgi:hypothetical protein
MVMTALHATGVGLVGPQADSITANATHEKIRRIIAPTFIGE